MTYIYHPIEGVSKEVADAIDTGSQIPYPIKEVLEFKSKVGLIYFPSLGVLLFALAFLLKQGWMFIPSLLLFVPLFIALGDIDFSIPRVTSKKYVKLQDALDSHACYHLCSNDMGILYGCRDEGTRRQVVSLLRNVDDSRKVRGNIKSSEIPEEIREKMFAYENLQLQKARTLVHEANVRELMSSPIMKKIENDPEPLVLTDSSEEDEARKDNWEMYNIKPVEV